MASGSILTSMPKKAQKSSAKKSTSAKKVGAETQAKKSAKKKKVNGPVNSEGKPKRSSYSDEFKAQAVAMFKELGSIVEAARVVGVPQKRLRAWVKKDARSSASPIGEVGRGSNRGPWPTSSVTKSSATNHQSSLNGDPSSGGDTNETGDADHQSHSTPTHDSDGRIHPRFQPRGHYLNHESRQDALDDLFKLMHHRVITEGGVLPAQSLKSIATGMAIVSDKMDLLKRKEAPLPGSAMPGELVEGESASHGPLPANVKRLLPKPKPAKPAKPAEDSTGEVAE